MRRASLTRDWDAVAGSLRGQYRFNECLSVFGGISQALRAPNHDDLSGNLTSHSGGDSLGSVDVQPEEFGESPQAQ